MQRQETLPAIVCNVDMSVAGQAILQFAGWELEFDVSGNESTQLVGAPIYHRILKLVRTSADLAGSEEIQSVHLGAAFYMRRLNICSKRRFWRFYLFCQFLQCLAQYQHCLQIIFK